MLCVERNGEDFSVTPTFSSSPRDLFLMRYNDTR